MTSTQDDLLPVQEWGLATHVPHELITAIFSWIHPHKVHKFRATCRLINEILETSHFHVTNMVTLFPKPTVASSLGTRILIKYAVFPDLETVKTVWEIGHPDATGRINHRQMDNGIIPIAKRLVRVLKLGDVDKVSPRSVWRQTAKSIDRMNMRDVDGTGPHPFNPATEVLVLVPSVLKEPQPTILAASSTEPQLRIPIPDWPRLRQDAPSRSLIQYCISPGTSHMFYTWRDTYPDVEGRLDMQDLDYLIIDISRDHQLENVVVRRISRDNTNCPKPTRLLLQSPSGEFLPFSPSSEALLFIPVGLDVVADPETMNHWNTLLSNGRSLMALERFDSALTVFNTLLIEKRDFYGNKDSRGYENLVDIASIFCHQKKFSESCTALSGYPSTSKARVDTAEVVQRILADCSNIERWTQMFDFPITAATLKLAQDVCIKQIKQDNFATAASMTSSNGYSLRRSKQYPEAIDIYQSYFSNLPPEGVIVDRLPTKEYKLFIFDHLNAMEGLVNIHYFQGRYREAVHGYQAVLAQRQILSKPEEIVVTKNNLCEALFEAMDFETCLPYAIVAYHTECKACGRAGEDCLDKMNVLGRCYFYVGNLDDALPLLQNYLVQCKKEYGEDAFSTFGAMRMIGRCLETTDPQQAHELYDKVEVKYYAEPGVNNENRLLIEWSRGSLWFQTGEFGKAESIWSKVLAERRNIDDQPDLLESISNLARLYHVIGDMEKATPLFREHVAILEGDKHHSPYQLTKAFVWLAAHLSKLGNNEAEVTDLLDQATLEFDRVDTSMEGAVFLPVTELFEVASNSLIKWSTRSS